MMGESFDGLVESRLFLLRRLRREAGGRSEPRRARVTAPANAQRVRSGSLVRALGAPASRDWKTSLGVATGRVKDRETAVHAACAAREPLVFQPNAGSGCRTRRRELARNPTPPRPVKPMCQRRRSPA